MGDVHFQPPQAPNPPPVYIPIGSERDKGKEKVRDDEDLDLGHTGAVPPQAGGAPKPATGTSNVIKEELKTKAEKERPTLAIYKDLCEKHGIDQKGALKFTHQIASTDGSTGKDAKDLKLVPYKNNKGNEYFKATVTFTIQQTDDKGNTKRVSYEQEIYTDVRVPYGKDSRAQEDALRLAEAKIQGYCLGVTTPVSKGNYKKIDALATQQFIKVKEIRADRNAITMPGDIYGRTTLSGNFYGKNITYEPKATTYNPLRRLANAVDFTGSVYRVKVEGKEYETSHLWRRPVVCEALQKHEQQVKDIAQVAISDKDEELKKDDLDHRISQAAIEVPDLLEKVRKDGAIDIVDAESRLEQESDVLSSNTEKNIINMISDGIEKKQEKVDKLIRKHKEATDLIQELDDKKADLQKVAQGSPPHQQLTADIDILKKKKAALITKMTPEKYKSVKKELANLRYQIEYDTIGLTGSARNLQTKRNQSNEHIKRLSDNYNALNTLYNLYGDEISPEQKKQIETSLTEQKKVVLNR